jgi:nucleotide-binding universal stress UspA family protein
LKSGHFAAWKPQDRRRACCAYIVFKEGLPEARPIDPDQVAASRGRLSSRGRLGSGPVPFELKNPLDPSGEPPSRQEALMYTNILIPTDGSELAGKAVQHGIALAKRIGAKATALTVLLPFHVLTTDAKMIEDTPARYKVRMQQHAEQTLGAVADAALTAGVTCEMVHVEHEHPYRAIIETAEAKGCDLIVMASHGRRGISAIVLGSETVKVLTHCKIPVLVHR